MKASKNVNIKRRNRVVEKGGSATGTKATLGNIPALELKAGLEALTKIGVVESLRKANQGISALLLNTDEALSIKLAVVYGAGLLVADDDDAWNALCAAEEWDDHPKLKPKRTEALRATLRLAVGFDGKRADSTVHRYFKALNPLFIKKIPAAEVPRLIRESGGIEKMRQNATRSIAIEGRSALLEILFSVTKPTRFNAFISVMPNVDGLSAATITKLKVQKSTKATL